MGQGGVGADAADHLSTGTAVYVAFQTRALDLEWIPADQAVVIVHNDDSLDRATVKRPVVTHIVNSTNVGFGAAVNQALDLVETSRVVLVNPDTALTPAHWDDLVTNAGANEIVTAALVDAEGRPTSTIGPYPSPTSLVLTALEVGRWLPRGGWGRRHLSLLLGRWGRDHVRSLEGHAQGWTLQDHWVSGALCSLPTAAMKAVSGFDPSYFLYLEDVDLCRRLRARVPGLELRVSSAAPARHDVGRRTTSRPSRRATHRFFLASAVVYAGQEQGRRWRLAHALLALLLRRARPTDRV